MSAQNLGEILRQSDQTSSMMSHAKFLLELRHILTKVLPCEIAAKCSIANYKSGNLIIFADNNAVAAKLKLLAGGLAGKISSHLQRTGRQVTAVLIEVQPRNSPPAVPIKSISLSESGAQTIRELSIQVVDIELKNALELLASRRPV